MEPLEAHITAEIIVRAYPFDCANTTTQAGHEAALAVYAPATTGATPVY